MKAFVIGVAEQKPSWDGANRVAQELRQYGHDATAFSGCTGHEARKRAQKDRRQPYPYSIKSHAMTDEDLREWIVPERYNEFIHSHYTKILQREKLMPAGIEKTNLPGVMGCFYSHLELWQRCRDLDEPIMIFEDDVKFYRNFEPVDWNGVLILSIGKETPAVEPYCSYLENPQGHPRAVPWPNSSMPGTSGYAIKPHAAASLLKFYRDYYCAADNAIHKFVVDIECHNYLMGRHLDASEGNISLIKTDVWK